MQYVLKELELTRPWPDRYGKHLKHSPRVPGPLRRLKLDKFCFVRHPLHWYQSAFRYSNDRKWPATWTKKRKHVFATLRSCRSNYFESFVIRMCAYNPGYLANLYAKYTNGDHTTTCRYENMCEDLIGVLTRHGYDVDPEQVRAMYDTKVNRSRGRYDLTLKPATMDRLLESEAATFQRYGYEPEGA